MLNKNMVGEYIFISKKIYPNVVMFYKDKDIIKSTEVTDANNQIISLIKQLHHEDSEYGKYVIENIEFIKEVILTKKGVSTFKIGLEKWKK